MVLASSHPLSDDAFQTKLFKFLVDAEGLGENSDGSNQITRPFRPYYDSNGIMTFGVGLNLRDAQNVYNVLLAFGMPEDDSTQKAAHDIAQFALSSGPTSRPITNDTLKTLNGYLTQTDDDGNSTTYHNGSFTIADEAEGKMVFTSAPPFEDEDSIYQRYLSEIPPTASMPDTQEQIALYSLTFNNVAKLIPPGSHLLADIQGGNRAEAWYEIRYDSNGGPLADQSGVSQRRYAEAQLLDLYGAASDPAGTGQPSPSTIQYGDVLDAYQTFTAHRDAIIEYEQLWADGITAANQKYGNVITVQTWAQAFDPAWQYLVTTYGGNLTFQEHGAQPFEEDDDESHVWAAPDGHTGDYSVSIALSGSDEPVVPAHYFLIGGDGTVVARSGSAPSPSDSVTIYDSGTGNDAVKYASTSGVNRVAKLEALTPTSGDPDAPTWRLDVTSTSSGGPTVQDLDYKFENLQLGGGTVTFSYDGSVKTDLKTVDAGSHGSSGGNNIKTLDLSGYKGTPFTATVNGKSVTFNGADIQGEVLQSDGITFENFDVLEGSANGDYIKGENDIRICQLSRQRSDVGRAARG